MCGRVRWFCICCVASFEGVSVFSRLGFSRFGILDLGPPSVQDTGYGTPWEGFARGALNDPRFRSCII